MQVYKRTLIGNDLEVERPEKEAPTLMVKERLVGVSRWAEDARSSIEVHAAHDDPIVLEGESGSGKEFIARLVHKCSARHQGPFVAISFNAVETASIEATLFGSIRVLASGYSYTQKGVVESADGGTLYINGLSSFGPSLQEKIARLIQYKEFCRMGDDTFEPVDVRIILGSMQSSQSSPESDRALEKSPIAVSDRLSVPPLRERKADIEILSHYFMKQFCRQSGKEEREFPVETTALLRRYDWPGNIGELKKAISCMIQESRPPILSRSLLPGYILESLRADFSPLPDEGMDLAEEVKQFEIQLLCAALKQCRGIQYKAAQLLKIKATTLNMKLSRYGIDVSSFK
ncbi:MAG: sigma 54-interacting transcriptional regulator [Blastocatellia bacterium]|nr:sigma 54-interacting transcriptional regulator [Blastocatellia bacterium]